MCGWIFRRLWTYKICPKVWAVGWAVGWAALTFPLAFLAQLGFSCVLNTGETESKLGGVSALLLWALILMLQMAALRSIERLAEAKAVFFYKSMAISMIEDGLHSARLEFPTRFVYDHGKEFEVNVAVERRTCETLWWLKLEVRHYTDRKSRVYTFGGGWRAFVLDNGISVGDLLVFELVGFSRFLVHLYPPDASVVPYQFTSHSCGNAGGFCRSVKEEPALLNSDEGMSPSPPSSPSDKLAFVPCFTKILCPSHLKRLDVPSQFWRSHGWKKYDRKVFSLEGPLKDGHVRAYVIRMPGQNKCCFGGQEWKLFCIANALKVGDLVSFTLTGSACFAVSVA